MNLTIRRATSSDEFAVRRLAALDSAFPPRVKCSSPRWATSSGAALSVDTGTAIADPFRASATWSTCCASGPAA